MAKFYAFYKETDGNEVCYGLKAKTKEDAQGEFLDAIMHGEVRDMDSSGSFTISEVH